MADDDFRKQLTGDPIMSELTRRYKRNSLAVSTLVLFSWASGVELSSATFFDVKPGHEAMYWGLWGLLIYTVFFFSIGYKQDWRKWHDRFKVGLSYARLRHMFQGTLLEKCMDANRLAQENERNDVIASVDRESQRLYLMHQDGGEVNSWMFPADSGRSLYISFWVWEVRFPQIVITIAFMRLVYLIITPQTIKETILTCAGWCL